MPWQLQLVGRDQLRHQLLVLAGVFADAQQRLADLRAEHNAELGEDGARLLQVGQGLVSVGLRGRS